MEPGVAGVQELQEFRSGAESHATRVEFFIAWKRMHHYPSSGKLRRPIL